MGDSEHKSVDGGDQGGAIGGDGGGTIVVAALASLSGEVSSAADRDGDLGADSSANRIGEAAVGV